MSAAKLPTKMQAIGINRTGDFEVVEKIELPVPANAPANVLVKACTIHAIGLHKSSADGAPYLRRFIMAALTSSIRTIGGCAGPTRCMYRR